MDTNMDKHDIQNRTDIMHLISTFYTHAMQDDIIGYFFTEVAHINLEEHLPVMYDFWENVLFQANKYHGDAMQKHVVLNQKSPLRPEHFERWLTLFTQTLDDSFTGPVTEQTRQRARHIAMTIQNRLTNGPRALPMSQPIKRVNR